MFKRSLLLMILTTVPLGYARADENVDTLLADAFKEVRMFSFKNAYKLYDQALKKSSKGSEAWQTALFGKGVCSLQLSPRNKESIGEAKELFERLIKETPRSRFSPRAMMNLARIAQAVDYYGDKPDISAARLLYRKVIDTYPKEPIANEATLRLAGTYVATYEDAQVRKGIAILMAWLKAHPDNPMASLMWQYAADAYFRPLGDYEKSLECYLKADALGFAEKGQEGPFYWRMARMAHRLMDRYNNADKPTLTKKYRDLAITYYAKVVTDAPTAGKAYEAQQILKSLGVTPPKLEMFERLRAMKASYSRSSSSERREKKEEAE